MYNNWKIHIECNINKQQNNPQQRLNLINLFCKVDEYKRKYKIEKDESYRSKRFLAPTKYFIIFCIIYLYTSIKIRYNLFQVLFKLFKIII